MESILKYIAYGVIIGIWGTFAWFGKMTIDSFQVVLEGALVVLGGAHVADTASSIVSTHAKPKEVLSNTESQT